MSKLPKFEDWTPPWGDGEFDADKAARLVYNLHVDKEALQGKVAEVETERQALQGKVDEFETKDLSEIDRLKRENEKLKTEKPASAGESKETIRLRVALEKGLTLAQAKRLAGDTEDELSADADAYLQEHGLTGGNRDSEDEKPPSARATGRVKTGLNRSGDEPVVTDPHKLMDLLPSR